MILEFSVRNFRSIYSETKISLVATKDHHLDSNVFATAAGYDLLNSAIIYGRNASGKSNFLTAIKALIFLITKSKDFKVDEDISSYEPFLLEESSKNQPIKFSISFIARDLLRYDFHVEYDSKHILSEELIFYPKKSPATLYKRKKGEKIKFGKYLRGNKKNIEDSIYPNQLFLSKIGSEKIEILENAYKFFKSDLYVNVNQHTDYEESLITWFSRLMAINQSPHFKKNITKLLCALDTDIADIKIAENNPDDFKFPEGMTDSEKKKILDRYKYFVKTVHNVYKNNRIVSKEEFPLEEESTGTKRIMALSGLIVDAITDGGVLIIDEFEKSLHPTLTRALFKVFHSKKSNPKNAQLIISTHDSSLLDPDIFRRDQIWITEKSATGASSLVSVAQIEGVRKNSPFEKWYLSGKLGGIPVVNDRDLVFTTHD